MKEFIEIMPSPFKCYLPRCETCSKKSLCILLWQFISIPIACQNICAAFVFILNCLCVR